MADRNALTLKKGPGGVLVLVVGGRVNEFDDGYIVDGREELVENARQSSGGVVVDFGQVESIGSVVIESLLAVWNEVDARGDEMALFDVSDTIVDTLDVTKLTDYWPVCETFEEAVQAVRSKN